MSEESLIETRKQKHQELNGGSYPTVFNKVFSSTQTVIRYIENYDNIVPRSLNLEEFIGDAAVRMRVCGRVRLFRKSGSIAFINLSDSTGSIQLIFSKVASEAFDKIKLIDLGDIIEVDGYPCVSKTNEKSLLVLSWRLLTKSVRPMPEKFAGLTNTETKYRKRYLDLISSEESKAVFMLRSGIIKAVRSFMDNINFMEVETSTLTSVVSGANAKPFTTHHNALDSDMYLRIAPELSLKRLLVGGFDKVYEIGRNYRNEGIDTRHNPEFTMMEYYEAYANFSTLIYRTERLLQYVDAECSKRLPESYLSYYNSFKLGRNFTFNEFKDISMWDAITNAASKAELMFNTNINPHTHEFISNDKPDINILNPSNERLLKIDMKSMLHDLIDSTTIGQKIGVLFEHLVEPFLTEDYRTENNEYSLPVFVTHYPKDISPLARANDKNPALTDRFELFVDGRELCNAFQELNDPVEQADRFKNQLESNDKDPMDFDHDYIEALEYGMPPAIGFGIGIDRLVMLITNRSNIKDVILFPTLKQENK